MTVLEVRDLRKSFGESEVLRGVGFSLGEGEVLSLIGSSGGGKTTLLRCLNFLETADSGEILVNGRTVFSAAPGAPARVAPEAQASFGLVFQQFHLFPQYTVLENLTLAPLLHLKKTCRGRVERRAGEVRIRARAEELLATVGLSDKADAYPAALSGGQSQRVAIARALMLDPPILCFDEPTSALDPERTREVLGVIRALRAAGRTMIIVTHEMAFARSVSDRVIFLADGRIEAEGTPDAVFDRAESDKLRAFLAAGGDGKKSEE